MNKNFTIELVGAAIALLAISLITWFLISLSKRRRTRKLARQVGNATTLPDNPSQNPTATGSLPVAQAPAEKWEATDFLLQTDPLGNVPGTGAERELIVASALALARHIEKASTHAPLWSVISARYQQEFPSPQALELVGLEESAEGYAARVSYHQKKYTILLGEAKPVALASAPFSAQLKEFLARNDDKKVYVLVIDGIAYSALALQLSA